MVEQKPASQSRRDSLAEDLFEVGVSQDKELRRLDDLFQGVGREMQ